MPATPTRDRISPEESTPKPLRRPDWIKVKAPSGEYEVNVRYIFGRVITGKARVEVIRYQNTDQEKRISLSPEIAERNATIKVIVERGRGTDLE